MYISNNRRKVIRKYLFNVLRLVNNFLFKINLTKYFPFKKCGVKNMLMYIIVYIMSRK